MKAAPGGSGRALKLLGDLFDGTDEPAGQPHEVDQNDNPDDHEGDLENGDCALALHLAISLKPDCLYPYGDII
jgi:hypothetical protein